MKSNRSWILVVQAIALGAGCRSTTQSTTTQQQALSRSDDRVITAATCAEYNPNGARCESSGFVCAGNVPCNWSCPTGPGTCQPPRCGMNRWSCLCSASANGTHGTNDLRWVCQVEMRPAGPMPPPELALDA